MLLSTALLGLLAQTALGKVAMAGVNIAGCDFGCTTDGYCADSDCPSSVGPPQMAHFAHKDSLNLFRLPVGWQYLVTSLGGPLNTTFVKTYDAIVQACLKTGAHCIVDVHNYARWDGGIIGQGGPSNEQFASLWTHLAKRYRHDSKVIFGIMNEPHDLDMNTWATTVQYVVKAIRRTGATSQLILLPGTDYTSAGDFATASAPALSKIKDHDGSTTKLIYDVHRYLDEDGSGTHAECVSNQIAGSFKPLGDYLQKHKRRALLSETGGGNTASCVKDVCAELEYLNKHSDVFLGWAGWAAGSFDPSYVLSEVPVDGKDTLLVRKCIAGQFK